MDAKVVLPDDATAEDLEGHIKSRWPTARVEVERAPEAPAKSPGQVAAEREHDYKKSVDSKMTQDVTKGIL